MELFLLSSIIILFLIYLFSVIYLSFWKMKILPKYILEKGSLFYGTLYNNNYKQVVRYKDKDKNFKQTDVYFTDNISSFEHNSNVSFYVLSLKDFNDFIAQYWFVKLFFSSEQDIIFVIEKHS